MKLARVAATLLAVTVLAACTDDPEPKVEPSETTSESSSSTEAADPRDLERAFLESYVKEISDSLSTGDPSGFIGLSDPKCESCQSLADNLAEAYRDGGRISGGRWHVSDANYVRQDSFGSIWNVDVVSSRERWLDGSGDTIRIIQPGVQNFGFAIRSAGSTFEMREIRTRP